MIQKWKWSGRLQYQYIAAISGSLGMMCTGMLLTWTTPSLPVLLDSHSPILVTDADGSWLAVIPYFSAIIGCLSAWATVDKIGRKYCILAATPLYFIAWILIAFSEEVNQLFCARFVSGIADGVLLSVYPIYLVEIADSKVRGLLGSSSVASTYIGFIFMSTIGSFLSIHSTAFVSSVLPIIYFLLFCFIPESPYYLLMKDRGEEARRSLVKLRGSDQVDEELKRLETAIKEDLQNKGSFLDLFRIKSNRNAVYIIIFLRGFQPLSGSMAITFYATIIFREAGSTLSPNTCTIIYFGIQMISSFISCSLSDRIGRRPLLIISAIGACIGLATQAIYFYLQANTTIDLTHISLVPVIALICYNFIYNLGMGTIPLMMVGELFPTSVKAFALCLSYIYFSVLVIIVSKLFQFIKDEFGIYIPFLIFSILAFCCFIYLLIFVPETKHKTLEEIQEILKRKRSK